MTTALLVFPHQLFADHPGLSGQADRIVLVEDSLFFGDRQYPLRFHKQRLWLHVASMAAYAETLGRVGHTAEFARYKHGVPVLKTLLAGLARDSVTTILSCDPVDFILEKRLREHCAAHGLALQLLPTPGFLNSQAENQSWRSGQKRWFMAEYYKSQRRRLDVLMAGDAPIGGQWSFDADNRKKVPKQLQADVPQLPALTPTPIEQAARMRIENDFPHHYGSLDTLYWPTTHEAAQGWLEAFLSQRFAYFGPYEDAILQGETLLWHSAITPMLNIGLLTPDQVLQSALAYGQAHTIPLASLEGFVRQVIGWREFMRATYDDLGVPMRTTNHWGHVRKIPQSFWTGQTGIPPIDDAIQRILKTGYCHHIERLMVLGGFMFLCEFDPDEIYRWFMEMFVDAYDWVMVPNVYAMSQHADGGLITTKPYFSGAAYLKKMGNHPTGDWCTIWDGLYWRFIWKNADALEKNPRWAMMVAMVRKMDTEKRAAHLQAAEAYLAQLG